MFYLVTPLIPKLSSTRCPCELWVFRLSYVFLVSYNLRTLPKRSYINAIAIPDYEMENRQV